MTTAITFIYVAGLRADAWKKSDVDVYLFTAEVFGAPWNEIG